MSGERHEFQAEVKQLLDLMVHSIYSNKDVFLRELVSNASDALDKLRFESITNADLRSSAAAEIIIERDSGERTLTITDYGIGMSRAEVVENIGTIARSGTKEFVRRLESAKQEGGELPPELIGQFGVGFYSAFMVANKIELVTRRAGEETGTRWVSEGGGGYEIEDAERPQPGTTVKLFLKDPDEDAALSDYTDENVIRRVIKRYSDFVAYPIKMKVWREELDDEGKPKAGAKVLEEVKLNSGKAIWSRSKDEVTDEEYKEFYHHISHDWTEPLRHLVVKIEGTFEANALLYIPSRAPFDLYQREMKRGVQLYVKRVFIMDECKELMPDYLRFIKGVVDAEDLSLNVSREILQKDRQIQVIRKQLTKRVLKTLGELLEEDRDAYVGFWKEFGPALKEGLLTGEARDQDTLMSLFLAPSSNDPTALTTLDAYIERMKPDQDAIYYMTGPSRAAIERSPHLEAFKDKGVEVLYLTHQVDDIWPERVGLYKDKKLVSVGKGQIDLGSEEERKQAEQAREEKEKAYSDLLTRIRVHLQDDVKEVRLSSRLKSSVACLVGEEGEITPQMAKMLESMGQTVPKVKRTLELNPEHPLVGKLSDIYKADDKDPRLETYAKLIFGQAVLAEGSQLDDPAAFSQLVGELMLNAVGGEAEAG